MGNRIVPLPFCLQIEDVKRREQNNEQLKLKINFFNYKWDALQEEITKVLARGRMPPRECIIWLEKGEELKRQVYELNSQLENSVLDESNVESLTVQIVKFLERSPIDRRISIDSKHVTTRRAKRSERKLFHKGKEAPRVKSHTKVDKKAMPTIEEVLVQSTASKDNMMSLQWKEQTAQSAGVQMKMATALELEEVKSETLAASVAKSLLAPGVPPASSTNKDQATQEVTPQKDECETDTIPSVSTEKVSVGPTLEAEEGDILKIVPSDESILSTVIPRFTLKMDDQGNKEAVKSQVAIPFRRKCDVSPPARELATSMTEEHILLPRPRLSMKTSIQHTVKKILGCLGDDNAKIIGIYGEGGIGKTSTLKALIDHPGAKSKFGINMWVTVSRCWSTRQIQNEIARQLTLKQVDSESEGEIGEKLFKALTKYEKFLLILDDVWQKIDLDAIGIRGSILNKNCRVIMASRLKEVCSVMAARAIEVKSLSSEDSWQLFCDQLGQVPNFPEVQLYAQYIVGQCHGLPLLIIVTGKALFEENDIETWKSAFQDFLLPMKAGTHDTEPTIQKLKFSYDRLKDRRMKNYRLRSCDLQGCFLYCALFAENHMVNVHEVVGYWIQEGFISGNVEDAHEKGYEIVKILRDAALLEGDEAGDFIKMHDVIREFALKIALPKIEARQFLVRPESRLTLESSLLSRSLDQNLLKAGGGLKKPPPEMEWKEAKMVFLMDNELSSLPKSPNCPHLSELFLQRNHHLREIPDSFFDSMPCLKVLNLSKTRITSLPKSVSKLKGLKELLLRDCERLVRLPSEIGKLEKLEVLDLHGTETTDLPTEPGDLSFLRHLEVSFYGTFDLIDYYCKLQSSLFSGGFISKLLCLRILRIDVYPGDQQWNNAVNNVITDIGNLVNLIDLRFYFPKVELLDRFLGISPSWRENALKNFNFVVGHDVKRMIARVPHDMEFEYNQQAQCLRFVNGESGEVPQAIIDVLVRSTAFYLDHHLKIPSLSEFGVRNIIGLKLCVVRECPEIETIVNGEELIFPFLEHLSIHYLGKLGSIWHGRMLDGSFSCLKYLCIHTCSKLKFVFTSSMCRYTYNLEELVVEDCQNIENLILQDITLEPSDLLLPRLKSLTLCHLPKLVSIWKGSWPPLEQMTFYHCPKLRNLHVDTKSELKRSLKKIKAEKKWWDGLEWEDPSLQQELQAHLNSFPEEVS